MASFTNLTGNSMLNNNFQNERTERNKMFYEAKNLIDESEGLLNEVTMTAEVMKHENDTIIARSALITEQIKNQQLYLDNVILKNKLEYLVKMIINNTPRQQVIDLIESLSEE